MNRAALDRRSLSVSGGRVTCPLVGCSRWCGSWRIRQGTLRGRRKRRPLTSSTSRRFRCAPPRHRSNQSSYLSAAESLDRSWILWFHSSTFECSWICTECSSMSLIAFVVIIFFFFFLNICLRYLFPQVTFREDDGTTASDAKQLVRCHRHRWRTDLVILKLFFAQNNVLEKVRAHPPKCSWISSHVLQMNLIRKITDYNRQLIGPTCSLLSRAF